MSLQMPNEHSVWRMLCDRKGNILDLPRLEHLVAPRDSVLRELMTSRACWIVGPPKIGKTVVAHYVAYLKWLAFAPLGQYPPEIMTIDGGAECARAVDLVIEAPYTSHLNIVVFENPFGASGNRPNSVFLRQLAVLMNERPDLNIIVTTRPRGYLEYEQDIARVSQYTTPLALSEWYTSEALIRYAAGRTATPIPDAHIEQLGTPALIDDYILHQVSPRTPAQRDVLRRRFGVNLDDVTVDKLSVLRSRDDLGRLAALLRLQEHASTLPTVDEISTLVGFDVESHEHIGLVAVPYAFDGLRRLRFEHATAREAADLLLTEYVQSDFAELRSLNRTAAIGSWIDRAITLWQAQQNIAKGDWAAFSSQREDVRVTLASDALALSGESIATAVDAIGDLSYDAWTAQDIAYEIVSAWPDYVSSPEVRRLTTRLMHDATIDGAYSILEALLYVRTQDVRAVWEELDKYLLDLAEKNVEPSDQLLLALDGLAWRPPPDWHELGTWAERAVESLNPEHDAWGFVRFMSGYHPEGISYLERRASGRVKELLLVDRNVELTAAQADKAMWLVKWHFVHQSRARAQLARQPWIDQQFLCQSFHSVAMKYDYDLNAARLIRSLRESGRDAGGWGFFLGENLRAVAPGTYGDRTQTESRLSLLAAEPGGTGVLAAVLTYAADPRLITEVKAHFRAPAAVSRLMEALTDGLVVVGTRLLEPRFSYRRSLGSIYATCGLEWSDLKAAIPSTDLLTSEGAFDVDGLIRRLQDAAVTLPAKDDPALGALLVEVVRRVRCGDLTALIPMEHRTRKNAEHSEYQQLLDSSIAFLATEEA